jgi:hypothetical protein
MEGCEGDGERELIKKEVMEGGEVPSRGCAGGEVPGVRHWREGGVEGNSGGRERCRVRERFRLLLSMPLPREPFFWGGGPRAMTLRTKAVISCTVLIRTCT